MYEFDSVSVSAFEAADLAAVLTEKSADGWDVAGIVTAGSDVVAFLRRATASDSPEAEDTTQGETDAVKPVSTLTATEPAAEQRDTVAASTASDLLAGGSTSSATPTQTGGTGWGAGSSSTATSSPSGWGSTEATASWGGSAQQAPAPPPQPVVPAVPAGWYADPAGRFELRYWDGGAWTEHVSRGGQQYTDPPVA